MISAKASLSRIGRSVLVAGAYVALAQVGYAFYFPGTDVATFWPASGLLLAVLVRIEGSRWAETLVAVFAGHIVADVLLKDIPISVSAGFAVSDLAEGTIGAFAVRRLFGRELRFDRLEQAVGLALVAGLLATPLSAIGGASTIHYGLHRPGFFHLYKTWWFGDALGILVVAPALLTFPSLAELRRIPRARWVEILAGTVACGALAQWTLGGDARSEFGFPYLAIPVLLLVAVRFGTTGASLVTLLFAGMAVFRARSGHGPFINVGTTAYDHVFALQSFVAVTYTAQLVAALQMQNQAALESLSLSTTQYRSLARAAPIAIFRTDFDGRVVYVNERFTEMTGLSPTDARGRDFRSVVHRDDAARVPVLPDTNDAAPAFEDFRVVSTDGTVHWVLGAVVPEVDPQGRRVGYVGTLADVTDRRHAEAERVDLEHRLRQSQKMDAIGRLAGGVAHDFNNMLTAILGYAHVIAERLDEGTPLWSFAEQIKTVGFRAAALTHQLLAFSRKQVLEPRTIDVNEVVDDATDMLTRLLSESIPLRTELTEHLGAVRADPNQLVQVLMNLVLNARDAMEGISGAVTIETRTSPTAPPSPHGGESLDESPRGFVVLSVTDTGHGMDEKTQRHLFEPFFTTKAEGKGTGLGLATVYGIVRQSGGSIVCSSKVGLGTRFDVYLPCVADAAIAPRRARSGDIAPRKRSGTLLLVEDDDDVRSLTRHVLESAGYQVLAARHADDAETLARQFEGPISVLVADVVMPRVPGPELARRLRELRPGLAVLYVSGYSDHPLLHEGKLRRDERFLAKPFTPQVLLDHVDERFAQSEAAPIASGEFSVG